MNTSILLAPINQFLQCKTPDAWIQQAIKPENLPIILIDHLVCELKAAQTAALILRKYVLNKESSDALLAWLAPFEAFAYRQETSLAELKSIKGFAKGMLKPKADLALSMFMAPEKSAQFLSLNLDALAGELIDSLVLLIKEELHHFIQVLEILVARNIPYQQLSASRYARGLIQGMRTHDPVALIDKLICGAYIESRSCERFAALVPYVDEQLAQFYVSLLRSEARHFEDYLSLAARFAGSTEKLPTGLSCTNAIQDRIDYFGQLEASLIQSRDSELRFHSGIPTGEM